MIQCHLHGDIFRLWVSKIKTTEEISEFFRSQNYKVQKYNSKSIWLSVNNRLQTMMSIQNELSSNNDCWHNKSASGSSIGALMINGHRVYFKELDKANVMKSEEEALMNLKHALNNAVSKTGAATTIILDNGRELKNPVDVVKTVGTPKSDFSIVNVDGEEIHISHKKGSKPNDFQQWSGCTDVEIASNSLPLS